MTMIFMGTGRAHLGVVQKDAEGKVISKTEPRPRFKTEEERAQHRIGISCRKHARMFNATFSPSSLYSTLTLNDAYKVHTFQEARRLRDNYYRRLRYHNPGGRKCDYCKDRPGRCTNCIVNEWKGDDGGE